jgi:hypothetical protein
MSWPYRHNQSGKSLTVRHPMRRPRLTACTHVTDWQHAHKTISRNWSGGGIRWTEPESSLIDLELAHPSIDAVQKHMDGHASSSSNSASTGILRTTGAGAPAVTNSSRLPFPSMLRTKRLFACSVSSAFPGNSALRRRMEDASPGQSERLDSARKGLGDFRLDLKPPLSLGQS